MEAVIYASPYPGEPVAQQLDRLQGYFRALQVDVVAQHTDEADGRRLGLEAAVIECRRIRGVFGVCRLERIGTIAEAVAMLHRLRQGRCEVVSLDERIDTTGPDGPGVWRLIRIAEGLAGVRLGRRKTAPAARPKTRRDRIRYGYRLQDGCVIADEGEQRILELIREMARRGMTPARICRALDEEGIPRRKGTWKGYHSWVKKILRRDGG